MCHRRLHNRGPVILGMTLFSATCFTLVSHLYLYEPPKPPVINAFKVDLLDKRPAKYDKDLFRQDFRSNGKHVYVALPNLRQPAAYIAANKKSDQYYDELLRKWHIPLREPYANPELAHNAKETIEQLNRGKDISIFFWDEKSSNAYLGLRRAPFLRHKCPVHNCLVTHDRRTQSKADVVVFGFPRVHSMPDQAKRKPLQKYVFLTRESQNNKKLNIASEMQGVFNVTMTFRLDSDIPHPYGVIEVLPDPSATHKPIKNFARGKTKLVAWVASHCPTTSAREEYVKELQRFVSVDTYGRCGHLTCNMSSRIDCLEMINRTYKFYLAFENSLCVDYITEKLYSMLDRGGIVPIVLGGAEYSHLLPPRSYIDIRDFPSPKHLADYLKLLDLHDELYNEYFIWQRYFRLTYADQSWRSQSMYCRLCAYLQQFKAHTQIYTNISTWWYGHGFSQCMDKNVYYGGHLELSSSIFLD